MNVLGIDLGFNSLKVAYYNSDEDEIKVTNFIFNPMLISLVGNSGKQINIIDFKEFPSENPYREIYRKIGKFLADRLHIEKLDVIAITGSTIARTQRKTSDASDFVRSRFLIANHMFDHIMTSKTKYLLIDTMTNVKSISKNDISNGILDLLSEPSKYALTHYVGSLYIAKVYLRNAVAVEMGTSSLSSSAVINGSVPKLSNVYLNPFIIRIGVLRTLKDLNVAIPFRDVEFNTVNSMPLLDIIKFLAKYESKYKSIYSKTIEFLNVYDYEILMKIKEENEKDKYDESDESSYYTSVLAYGGYIPYKLIKKYDMYMVYSYIINEIYYKIRKTIIKSALRYGFEEEPYLLVSGVGEQILHDVISGSIAAKDVQLSSVKNKVFSAYASPIGILLLVLDQIGYEYNFSSINAKHISIIKEILSGDEL